MQMMMRRRRTRKTEKELQELEAGEDYVGPSYYIIYIQEGRGRGLLPVPFVSHRSCDHSFFLFVFTGVVESYKNDLLLTRTGYIKRHGGIVTDRWMDDWTLSSKNPREVAPHTAKMRLMDIHRKQDLRRNPTNGT